MLGGDPSSKDVADVALRPEPPHLMRASAREHASSRHSRVPGWVRRVLGVPVAWKLTGVNLIIGAAAAAAVFALHRAGEERWLQLLLILAAALSLSLLVSFALVRIALRPLLALEIAADRVWRGDFSARVRNSLLADRDMTRVGNTFNLLLDSIERDRARMRRLASQVIAAQDEERARVARELHDSVAQTLAALVLQLSAAQRKNGDPELTEQLDLVRSIAGEALEEVRLLSHTVHPRVLEDLGLPAALEWLARQTRESEGLAIDVRASAVPEALPPVSAAALYRVAQEALRNAARHARARHIQIVLEPTGDGMLRLDLSDDGVGFDVAAAEERRPGMGLFSMRERVALVDGNMEIASMPGAGTRIRAQVPLARGRES